MIESSGWWDDSCDINVRFLGADYLGGAFDLYASDWGNITLTRREALELANYILENSQPKEADDAGRNV